MLQSDKILHSSYISKSWRESVYNLLYPSNTNIIADLPIKKVSEQLWFCIGYLPRQDQGWATASLVQDEWKKAANLLNGSGGGSL